MAEQAKKTAAPCKSIEALKAEHKVSDAVFEGTKAANGWKTGKQVSDAEFVRAVEVFKKAPIDGQGKKEARK